MYKNTYTQLKKIYPFTIIILLLVAWWMLTTFKFVDPFQLPTLTDTLDAFTENIYAHLSDIGLTLYRVAFGFILAGICAIPLGLILGINDKIYRMSEIIIDFCRSIPATALYPLFLVFFGIGDGAKLALATFVSFWVILVHTIYGVWNATKLRTKVASMFKASRFRTITDVIFWDALPQIFIGLRIAVSLSFMVIVVSEMFIGTRFGLGQILYESYITFQIARLYATIIIIGMIGYGINKLFLLFERRVVHWVGK